MEKRSRKLLKTEFCQVPRFRPEDMFNENVESRKPIPKSNRKQTSLPKKLSVTTVLKATCKTVLVPAVVYGLSAAFPPVGAVAVPLYHVYGYADLGRGLYGVCKEWSEHRKITGKAVEGMAGPSAELTSQPLADKVASRLVDGANRVGLFDGLAKQTGVEPVVMKEMVRGSTSSALSSGAGQLARFAIKGAVGA